MVFVLFFLAAGSLVTGCSDSGKQQAVPVPVAVKPKPQLVTQATSTAKEEQPPVYSYSATGKRDPFAPIFVKEDRRAQAQSGDRSPLERFNLHEFKLTGIVWGGFGYNAMVDAPDGKGYFVRIGTIMGPNKGVVKKITQHTMVIEEKFKTISGEIDRKEIVIELRKKQEGMQ